MTIDCREVPEQGWARSGIAGEIKERAMKKPTKRKIRAPGLIVLLAVLLELGTAGTIAGLAYAQPPEGTLLGDLVIPNTE